MGIKSSSQGNEKNRQERGNAQFVPAETTTSGAGKGRKDETRASVEAVAQTSLEPDDPVTMANKTYDTGILGNQAKWI